jgi:hypothetical protein
MYHVGLMVPEKVGKAHIAVYQVVLFVHGLKNVHQLTEIICRSHCPPFGLHTNVCTYISLCMRT